MPLRIRQGSDQPFNVATARYGLPLGGASGGCMAGESVDTISGSAASALLATAPAATAKPALPKNFRREYMVVPLALLRGIAQQCRVELRFGDPEIPHALNVAIEGRRLFAGTGQQFENADLRCVVAQQVLQRDGLAQRHYLIALPLGQLEGRAVVGIGQANLRARLNGSLRETIDRLRVEGFRFFDARGAAVEYRNFEGNRIAPFVGSIARTLLHARRPGVEYIHKARAAGELEAALQLIHAQAHQLQVEPILQ